MKRSAFTLVELLVVITVVGLLMAILIPAINMARESARRGQCISRQRDIALAMITYGTDYNGLPGYLNQFGNNDVHSWVVVILPMIGENKRYELLTGDTPDSTAAVLLPAVICPTAYTNGKEGLSYVVNCGPVAVPGITGDVTPYFTLFKDRRANLTSINTKVKLDEIVDGANNTILLSENLNAGVWWANILNGANDELPTAANIFTRNNTAVLNLGFIWSYILSDPATIPTMDASYRPNAVTAPGVAPRRPSSKHPGTVITAYADGSAKPMLDDISAELYLKAVCPDDQKAQKTVGNGGLKL